MFPTAATTMERHGVTGRASPDSRMHAVSDACEGLRRHFREKYPILLDGALPHGADRGHFIRQARESLTRGKYDAGLLPAAILRETLESITSTPRPTTHAGLTAVGPKNVRLWWDAGILDNLDDILARLDKPRPLLRFYDVTGLDPEAGRWNEFFDVDVALGDCGRTIELAKSDRVFVVDLGYAYADGRFLRLARTNTAHLPREGRGVPGDGAVARSILRPRSEAARPLVPAPDARALEWAEARPDHESRDMEAELFVHMLYRMFLNDGPRALRQVSGPIRRDDAVLHKEFAQRDRVRLRRAAAKRVKKKPAAPGVLVVRLDSRRQPAVDSVRYQMIPIRQAAALAPRLAVSGENDERLAWQLSLLAAAQGGLGLRIRNGNVLPPSLAAPAAEEIRIPAGSLVRPVAKPDAGLAAAASLAKPVFEAAESLRESLAGLSRLSDENLDLELPDDTEHEEDLPARRRSAAERIFGGVEAKRMAKAGVRITRLALTLEGRMRPGARFKVAGKLVHADADGCFRLECVLAGRKASIPLRAGASVGGEVRSLINVDWERRAGRERKSLAEK